MKRIGERIKRKRGLLNLQLNDLARKVGISPGALSQIEKAKAFPSIVTLKSIAENLHTTVGELVGENESLSNHPSDVKCGLNAGVKPFYLLTGHGNKHKDELTHDIKICEGILDAAYYVINIENRVNIEDF